MRAYIDSKFGVIKYGDRFKGQITGIAATFELEVVEFREKDRTPILKVVGAEGHYDLYLRYPNLKEGDYILRERIGE